ncbi:hypothetical protein [Anoxybacteroides tepidamans]|nr:hypothetical protein [Anoxybacillus tepidamans]
MGITETSTYSSFITKWLPITIVAVSVAIIVLAGIFIFTALNKK